MRHRFTIFLLSLFFAGTAFGQSFDVFNGGRGHWWSPNDTYETVIRTGSGATETYNMRWPVDKGEPNSVLMTPGEADSQLRWGTVDPNLMDGNDITLPYLTPGSRIFVDANGFPLFEDNDNAYFDDINDFAGFALGHIAGDPKPNNYIQVYYLLNFDPDLLNTSVGWSRLDVLDGPNNLRIGEGAGGMLETAIENTLGGKDAGRYLVDTNDNTGWGYKVIGGSAAIGEAPTSSYKWTYISESSYIWGIPIIDRAMFSLDAEGTARDVGGGIVGLPWIGQPFAIGDTIQITNTTNYNNQFTLEAGTTANELQITSSYNAETFDGTEIIVKRLAVNTGFGTMVQASDGTLYYGHTWNAGNNTYVTKVETDDTLVYDFLNHSWSGSQSGAMELVLSQNDTYLYICFPGYLEKYELSTGDLVWRVSTDTLTSYNCAIDADDNVYIPDPWLTESTFNVRKFAAADGANTELTEITGVFAIAVSDELGVVVSGGSKAWLNKDNLDRFHNLSVRKLDDSSGARVTLGDLFYTGNWNSYGMAKQSIATYGSYIYVLIFNPTSTLYKLDVDLNIIAEVAGPSNGQGIYFDLWGNLVVINSTDAESTDILWFYDANLNYLSKLENMPILICDGWNVLAYIKGNAVFYPGTESTITYPDVQRVTALGAYAAARVQQGADDGLYLGAYSGAYNETDPNRFFLDNLDRGDYPGNKQHGLMYGYMDRDPNKQWVVFNFDVNMPNHSLDVNDITVEDLTVSGLTDDSLIYPSSGALTSLGVASNGQLPIGSTGTTPVLATLTGTTNQINVNNGAGTITLGTPQNIDPNADVEFGSVTITKGSGFLLLEGTGFLLLEGTGRLILQGSPIEGAITYLDENGMINYNNELKWDTGTSTFTITGDIVLNTGALYLQEITTPTPKSGYGAIYPTSDNELFFQDGDGDEHLLHGDAFSNIWFHAPSSVEVAIAIQDSLTKIDSFTVVGHEDDIGNVVGSAATNNLTLASVAGGEYEISFHGSITATGGADKEMMLALGITLATPKDITNVTDDLVSPIVITSVGHGLENGDMVEIVGVLVNTAANGSFIVDSKAADTFEIVALDAGVTTGNGDYDEGTPTGDVTILYPGNMEIHRMVRGADFGSISATGVHLLAGSDVLAFYVANLSGLTNLTVSSVSLSAFRIGD